MYTHADDAHHGHMTLTKSNKVCKSHNYPTPAKAAFVALKKDLVHLVELPEVPKPKEERIRQLFINL